MGYKLSYLSYQKPQINADLHGASALMWILRGDEMIQAKKNPEELEW